MLRVGIGDSLLRAAYHHWQILPMAFRDRAALRPHSFLVLLVLLGRPKPASRCLRQGAASLPRRAYKSIARSSAAMSSGVVDAQAGTLTPMRILFVCSESWLGGFRRMN